MALFTKNNLGPVSPKSATGRKCLHVITQPYDGLESRNQVLGSNRGLILGFNQLRKTFSAGSVSFIINATRGAFHWLEGLGISVSIKRLVIVTVCHFLFIYTI